MITCPFCGSPAMVMPVDGGHLAHCSGCFDPNPKAMGVHRIRATADTQDQAIEEWLELSRALASVGMIPRMRIPYAISTFWIDLQAQVDFEDYERARRGEHLIDIEKENVIAGKRVAKAYQYLESSCP